ncbi:MAG: hypothetical protein AAF492_11420, partial [Verrucomicrobiota bacterium]
AYVALTPGPENSDAVTKTIVNDRVGNVEEFFFDVGNRLVRHREYTGRANSALPTTESVNRPAGKLRPGDPDFFETRFAWNADSLLTRETSPNGNITEYVYESDLNGAASPRERLNLRIKRRLPGAHSPAGDQAVIVEQFDYLAHFGGEGFVTRHVDGRSNDTVHAYDANGNRTSTVHRINSIVEDFEYNAFGQMTAWVHPDNGSGHRRRDEFVYYTNGIQRGYREAEIVDASNFGLTTTWDYDGVGNIVRVTDPRGNDTRYVVNQLNQVVRQVSREVTDGSGVRYIRDTHYDGNDNIVRFDVQNVDDTGTVQANSNFTTRLEYDILDKLTNQIQEISPTEEIVVSYAYDANRNRILERYGESVNGNQPANQIQCEYDERNLKFREIRAPGHADQSTTQFDYDRNGNLVATHQGLEGTPRVAVQTWDGYDRRVSRADAMGNVAEFSFDANHNIVTQRVEGELNDVPGGAGNLRLRELTFVYDAMDRETHRHEAFFNPTNQAAIADGLASEQKVYSDHSQVIRLINDNHHTSSLSYDTANRLSHLVDPRSNVLTYAYDRNSNLTNTHSLEKSDLGNPDEAFAVARSYDNLDRLIRIEDNRTNVYEFGFDSRDNRILASDSLRSSPNTPGNITRREYDGLDRITVVRRQLTDTGAGDGALVDEIVTSNTWDQSSRLTAVIDDNGRRTEYTYDPLNRLVATIFADLTSETRGYDVHDNVTVTTDGNGSTVQQ